MITQAKTAQFFGDTHRARLFFPHLVRIMPVYGIDTPKEIAAFLAQAAHESAGFTRLVENTNYTSVERLMKVFPRHFKSVKEARLYVGQPQKIANRVYANRYGNGPESSGDGYRYRGRGLFHLTFYDNYRLAGARIHGDPMFYVKAPEKVAEPEHAVITACWFWQHTGCGSLVDNYEALTKRINGGLNGYQDRLKWLEKAKQIFL